MEPAKIRAARRSIDDALTALNSARIAMRHQDPAVEDTNGLDEVNLAIEHLHRAMTKLNNIGPRQDEIR